MKATSEQRVQLGKRLVHYRVIDSKAAKKRRLRIGPSGVELVQPATWDGEDECAFLIRNEEWILAQLRRVDRLRRVLRPERRMTGEILFRGRATALRTESLETRARGNKVRLEDREIVIQFGARSVTPVARSLETWLRKQARTSIERHLSRVTEQLNQQPGRVYVMGQRTKWGNCSARRNLTFNWRLILAPDFVLHYLVTHEAVHLAVPDHSAKFWLTVQSLCPDTERAKQWLCRHHAQLTVDLGAVLEGV